MKKLKPNWLVQLANTTEPGERLMEAEKPDVLANTAQLAMMKIEGIIELTWKDWTEWAN